ncbi:MAG: H-NS family nucleoid-associated regulatory protein [Rudaea sp.]
MAINLKGLNHGQLDELIQRAEARKRELAKERVGKVREKIAALAKAEGFNVEDLFGGRGGRKTRRPAKPKFRNPADHAQTWSGRGKRPRWFSAALAAGKKEKDLLI